VLIIHFSYVLGHSRAVDFWSLGILLYEMLVGIPPFFSENINETYNMILKADVEYPRDMSADCEDLIRGLLNKDPNKRLSISSIKNHKLFSDIDWNKLLAKQIIAPFVPEFEDDDTKYFDVEFTRERANDSFALVPRYNINEFPHYDYSKDKEQSK
jgi:serum/glucocorticoid-regulated kinase 2